MEVGLWCHCADFGKHVVLGLGLGWDNTIVNESVVVGGETWKDEKAWYVYSPSRSTVHQGMALL